MKKQNRISITFQPTFQVHDAGERWALAFDSNAAFDLLRAPRIVFVPKNGLKSVALDFEKVQTSTSSDGIDQLKTESKPGLHHYDGKLVLTVELANGQSERHDLGTYLFELSRAADPDQVRHAVRQGASAALTGILPELFEAFAPSAPVGMEAEVVDVARAPRQHRSAAAGRRPGAVPRESAVRRYGPWAAVAAAVVLAWLAMAAMSSHSPANAQAAQTAQEAVQSQLQAPNQADVQAQVELTKETLQSMGLDPGASGDTGCLVQPQAQQH
jgi:hypothetical protein